MTSEDDKVLKTLRVYATTYKRMPTYKELEYHTQIDRHGLYRSLNRLAKSKRIETTKKSIPYILTNLSWWNC